MSRLIDANALIAEMHNIILEDGEDRRIIYEVIERQPTIDPVKHGRWILDGEYDDLWRCSECEYEFTTEGTDIPTYFYCPDCGAKMDEVEK